MTEASSAIPAEAAKALKAWVDELHASQAKRLEYDRKVSQLQELIRRTEEMYGIVPGGEGSQLTNLPNTRVGAILEILQEDGGPVALSHIDEVLREAGRPETRKDIAAAMSYLGANGKVERVGRGLWQIAT